MRFSTKEDYGIAFMTFLAERYRKGPQPLKSAAEEEHIPFLYLEKIAQRLNTLGYVKSTRGAHGGYEMARDPANITVGEIIRAFRDPGVIRCTGRHSTCPREDVCRTKFIWQGVQELVDQKLDDITIHAVVNHVQKIHHD